MDVPPDIPHLQLATPLTPHRAKRLFRSLLPIFAGYWHEASHARPEEGDSAWMEYVTLLRACQHILDHAPMHPNEAVQVNAERRLERALETLATALHTILPTSLRELDYYIIDEAVQERRRQQGFNRYNRTKAAKAKRYRKH